MRLLTNLRRFFLPLVIGTLLLIILSPAGAFAQGSVKSPDWRALRMPLAPHASVRRISQVALDGSCLDGTASIRCYDPVRFWNAYSIGPLFKQRIAGQGQTIVIIDAYQSPTIKHDLTLFDQSTGLPDPKLNIIAPDGLTPFDPNNPDMTGSAFEISLDVEWAHAIVPFATIDLVLAKSNLLQDLASVTLYAVQHNLGGVISQSFGINETCAPQYDQVMHQIYQLATQQKISLFASTGDQGAAELDCSGQNFVKAIQYPASDPLVTAVGGTSLNADVQTEAYKSETVWNDTDQFGSTGGGFSTVVARPSYQNGLAGIGKGRGIPDVAFDADPETGVIVVCSSSGDGSDAFLIAGGTSASSPEWAAVAALADQLAGKRLGLLNPALYAIGESKVYHQYFHDITKGNNSVSGSLNGNTFNIHGYDAGAGWDATIGWGSPIVSKLVPLLVALLK